MDYQILAGICDYLSIYIFYLSHLIIMTSLSTLYILYLFIYLLYDIFNLCIYLFIMMSLYPPPQQISRGYSNVIRSSSEEAKWTTCG